MEEINKIFNWDISANCNYKCSYCYALAGQIDKHKLAKPLAVLKGIKSNLQGQWTVCLGGLGEPFLAKDFSKIINGLVELNYKILIVTNMSATIEKIKDVCHMMGSNLINFTASYHPEFISREEFLRKAYVVKKFCDDRFTIVSVANKNNLSKLARDLDTFRRAGFYVTMQLERDRYSQYRKIVSYGSKDLDLISKFRVSTEKDLVFNRRKCWAGCRYFKIDVYGDAWRCNNACRQNNIAEKLGSFVNGKVKLFTKPQQCFYRICNCLTPFLNKIIID